AAALLLAIHPALGEEGTADLSGNWCSEKQGCTHWWTRYSVDVERPAVGQDEQKIAVRDRDTDFVLFVGTVSTKERTVRGPLEGRVKETDVELAVTGGDGKKALDDLLAAPKKVAEVKIDSLKVLSVRGTATRKGESEVDIKPAQGSFTAEMKDLKVTG